MLGRYYSVQLSTGSYYSEFINRRDKLSIEWNVKGCERWLKKARRFLQVSYDRLHPHPQLGMRATSQCHDTGNADSLDRIAMAC
jgi:hypothetical protein